MSTELLEDLEPTDSIRIHYIARSDLGNYGRIPANTFGSLLQYYSDIDELLEYSIQLKYNEDREYDEHFDAWSFLSSEFVNSPHGNDQSLGKLVASGVFNSAYYSQIRNDFNEYHPDIIYINIGQSIEVEIQARPGYAIGVFSGTESEDPEENTINDVEIIEDNATGEEVTKFYLPPIHIEKSVLRMRRIFKTIPRNVRYIR